MYVLQIEGAKRWRVYAPPRGHVLPRASSPDFCEADLGAPVLDALLEPGDMLYLPRGAVHQAVAAAGPPSLHLTLSANQRRSWLDLLRPAFEARRRPLAAPRLHLHRPC